MSIAALVLLVGAAAATWFLPSIWRGERRGVDGPQPWWPYGDSAWRHFFRTMPLGIVGSWLIALLALAAPFLPRQPSESPAWVLLLMVMWLLIFLLVVLLAASIWLWNRPAFLVPPYLREQPGALSRTQSHGSDSTRDARGP